MAKGRVAIDEARCKGCSLCTLVCPPGVLVVATDRLTPQGYHPAELRDPEHKCTGCGLCAVICPDVCFTVFREGAPSLRASAQGASGRAARVGGRP